MRADIDDADDLREKLVAELLSQQKIVSKPIETAFRRVPRQHFMPAETDPSVAYGYDASVVTKRDGDGRAMSSVSAAYVQAAMLEMAQLRPGMTVLEVGSGGLNAAYIAEIVGPGGRAVSIDIDPEVIDRASMALDATGYSRVRVLVADAEYGVADEGPFDAIIVTVGAWDIAPAWLDQLRPEGILVLPLVMNNVTRIVAFRRHGDHLTSIATEVAGFVPMQGDGLHTDEVIELRDPNGGLVHLTFDSSPPGDTGQLREVLSAGPTESWSGVTIGHGISFADLHLWLAWNLDGFCRLAADEGTALAAQKRWLPFAVVRDAGLAHLVLRDALDGAGAEFGARAYGPDAHLAATALINHIQSWNDHGRSTEPSFRYWPRDSQLTMTPGDSGVMNKVHGVVTMSWPSRRIVGAAIVKDGRVLACQRTAPDDLAGFWEFPGGRVEPGESEAEALARECREELDIEINVGRRVGNDALLSNGKAVLRIYTAELMHGQPTLKCHSDLRWLAFDELDAVPWLAADAPTARALSAILGKSAIV